VSHKITRRQTLKIAAVGALALAASPALAAYAAYVEPRWLQVTRLRLALSRLPAALEGLTIAQLTDIHWGAGHPPLRQAVDMVNAARPDLVVLTGDYIFGSADFARPCARELAHLHAPHGVYAVPGNHDHWHDVETVMATLQEAGIVVLRNEAVTLEVRGARLHLLGVDDFGGGITSTYSRGDLTRRWADGLAFLERELPTIPADELRILLVHNPDFALVLPSGVDVMLSGHTHGGQIQLPLLGPLIVPAHRQFAAGRVALGRTLLYVSRGIGCIPPTVRFLCRPEVTMLTLATKSGE